MKKQDCDLCQRLTINDGRDKLLHEDEFCYIIENGKPQILIDGKLKLAKKRMSLIINEHKACLNSEEESKIKSYFKSYLLREFGLKNHKDYIMKTTGVTYPDHYHIHAFFISFLQIKKTNTILSFFRKKSFIKNKIFII